MELAMKQEPTIDLQVIVDQAIKLLVTGENANWDLARLTYEYTFSHGEVNRHRTNPDKMSLKAWAKLIRDGSGRRFSDRTAMRYRKLWETHGLTGEDLTKLEFYESLSQLTKDETVEKAEPTPEPTPQPSNVTTFRPRETQDEDDDDDGGLISDERLAELERTDPVLSGIVRERNLTDFQLLAIDATEALADARRSIEKLGLEEVQLGELDQQVMSKLLEEARETISLIERITNASTSKLTVVK